MKENEKIEKRFLNFENSLNELIKLGLELISKVENIELLNKNKELLLESLLLRACALWERFIENEINNLIILDTSKFLDYFGLPPKTDVNLKLIKAIIYSDRYKDFKDLDQSIPYFSKILVDKYNYFKAITGEKKKYLSFTYKIRNYLSHYSDYAKKKLLNSYKEDYQCSNFIEPGKFLLKNKGKYFEKLIHNFVLISALMRSKMKGN